jgi:tetratricopeptide (TPR) repeat protein
MSAKLSRAKITVIVAAALVAATFLVYRPVWRAGFIWDDDDHLTANPAMTAPNGLQMIWTSLAVSRYYPLTLTTFWVEHRLWGLNPLPYHLVNIALHALNGFLVFLLLRRLRVPAPWLAAVIWTLHPVGVESVAWITELKNTQSGLFFFLALLCYLRYEENRKAAWHVLAFLCAAAAMLSKPSTVVLPAVMLLCVWWERGRWRWQDFVRVSPFVLLSAGISALTILEQKGHIERSGMIESPLNWAERFIVAGQAVWFYAGKVLWPVQLAFIYPRWEFNTRAVVSWLPLAGAIVLGVGLLLLRRHSWARAALFGLGCFVVGLAPVLGFFEVFYFRYSFVADHFQYLASLALITLVTSGLVGYGRRVGVGVGSVLVVVLAGMSWRQAGIYRDPIALWQDTLTKNPECWMAQNNIGVSLYDRDRIREAIAHYEKALQKNPDLAIVHYNLANALCQLNRPAEAILHYQRALQLRPRYAEAHSNYGQALQQMGKNGEAIQEYIAALEIKPDIATTRNNLGNALFQAGRTVDSIGQYEEALRLQPDFAEARKNLAAAEYTLGNSFYIVGLFDDAARHFQVALQNNPNLAAAHLNLGDIFLRKGQWDDAVQQYEAASKLDPSDMETWFNLGLALIKSGKPQDAVGCYERAMKLAPDNLRAQNNLARLLAILTPAQGGNAPRAVALAERVIAQPGGQQLAYVDTLAIAYAADGRFADAIVVGEKALELARAGQLQWVGELEARLELYRAGKPYRQLPGTSDSAGH